NTSIKQIPPTLYMPENGRFDLFRIKKTDFTKWSHFPQPNPDIRNKNPKTKKDDLPAVSHPYNCYSCASSVNSTLISSSTDSPFCNFSTVSTPVAPIRSGCWAPVAPRPPFSTELIASSEPSKPMTSTSSGADSNAPSAISSL